VQVGDANAPDAATRAAMPVAVTSSGNSNIAYTSTPPQDVPIPEQLAAQGLEQRRDCRGAVLRRREQLREGLRGLESMEQVRAHLRSPPGWTYQTPHAAQHLKTLRPPLTAGNIRHRQMLPTVAAATRRAKPGSGPAEDRHSGRSSHDASHCPAAGWTGRHEGVERHVGEQLH
jgi:hypothetical protein